MRGAPLVGPVAADRETGAPEYGSPRPARRHGLRTLVIVLLIVVVLIAPVWYLTQTYTTSPTSPGPPNNVRLDLYPNGSSYSGEYGDEPFVASAPNASLDVAWIGYHLMAEPTSPSAPANYSTEIWWASSSNAGKTYSTPIPVSLPTEEYSFDPSIAVLANGTVAVAWVNTTAVNGTYTIDVATRAPGAPGFTVRTVESGRGLDRPWLCAGTNGTLLLVYEAAGTDLFWTVSPNGGATFGTPRVVLLHALPTAVAAGPGNTFYVAALGEELYAENGTDGPLPAEIEVASVNISSNSVSSSIVATVWMAHPLDFLLANESHPGPAIAYAGGDLVVVYTADNDSELLWSESADGGTSWSSPAILAQGAGSLFEMPWVATVDGRIATAWESNAGGFWNTYSATYLPQGSPSGSPVEVSSANGYPADVMNWHGDFLSIAATSGGRYVVAWADGRGLPDIYGLDHIYAATLPDGS
jgi:hypothetical protein